MDREKTKNAYVIRGRDCQNGFVRENAAAGWGINTDIVIGRLISICKPALCNQQWNLVTRFFSVGRCDYRLFVLGLQNTDQQGCGSERSLAFILLGKFLK